jgi:hypothetical protein
MVPNVNGSTPEDSSSQMENVSAGPQYVSHSVITTIREVRITHKASLREGGAENER